MKNLCRHLGAILFLPGMVLVVIPGLILFSSRSFNPGWSLPIPLGLIPATAGALFVGAGLVLMVLTIRLFAIQGHGTLAPWDPPQKLVVNGIYQHVRNPMISGVLSILLGEGLLAGSADLLLWLGIALTINMLYIPMVEERSLLQRFGDDYQRYRENVPRWIPRLKGWKDNKPPADT